MKVVVVVGPDVRGMVLLLTTRADAKGGREMRVPDMVELERRSQDASTESSSHHIIVTHTLMATNRGNTFENWDMNKDNWRKKPDSGQPMYFLDTCRYMATKGIRSAQLNQTDKQALTKSPR